MKVNVKFSDNTRKLDVGFRELYVVTPEVHWDDIPDAPTKLSEFENDSGFITADDSPTKLSEMENDAGYITASDIPEVPDKLSEFENDAGFITSKDIPAIPKVPTKLSEFENDSGFITSKDIPDVEVPTKLSELENDKGYITAADIPDTPSIKVPTKLSEFENDTGFVDQEYVDNAIATVPGGEGGGSAVLYTPQTLTEEQQTRARENIGAVSEEDVIDMIENGTEQKIDATGDIAEFDFEEETPITVISKIHRDSSWEPSNKLVLHHVQGNNFVDFSTYIGGAGKVIEKDGVTATVNSDSTVTIRGTNTSTGYNLIINQYHWGGTESEKIYPAGRYTLPKGFTMAIRAAKYPTNETVPGYGNLSGTVNITVPFRIIMVMYSVKSSESVDVTLPLGLYYNTAVPETGYEYSGNLYTVTFDSPIYEGEFNWTTGELKDSIGNTVGYYEVPEIKSFEGINHFWTGFGENTVTNLQEKESVLVQLNETVPEGSMASICDFTFKPTTPLCTYYLSDNNILINGKFTGREIPLLTTQGSLKVTDRNNNIKFEKYINPIIGVNRNNWNVSDTLNQDGLYKAWSKKFYLTMGRNYISREDFDYGSGATNSLYTFEFDESDFIDVGIPAKLDNIPVATPCFYTGGNIDGWLSSRVYGGQSFPLKFSYNQETGKYIMTIRGVGVDIIDHQLSSYSKTYIYYRLETPYYENNFLAMGIEPGDKISFENDYSDIQEYLDTNGFFNGDAGGNNITNIDITPTVSVVVPLTEKSALNGFSNAAKIFNEGQSASEDIAQDYSWIGDGDGITDYTSVIQKKVDELVSTSDGGTIFLGNGTYNISNFIELYRNIRLIGTGNTIIQQTDKNSHVLVVSGNNITIKDLKLKLYTMTNEEKEDPQNYCSELTACIYINSNNSKSREDYNDKYLDNSYCQHLTVDGVYMIGSYGFKWVNGTPEISNDYEYYRGCGLITERLYFNYATLKNIHISNMYNGFRGCGGSNEITIFCESTKVMFQGGGGYANLNIHGHSYYGTNSEGKVISMSDTVGNFEYMEQSYIAEYVYDSQWIKNIFIFDGYSMNNRYLISQIAGASYSSNDATDENIILQHHVIDYGRGNRPVENYQNRPYHIGTKYIEKTGLTSFKACDPITQNALSGAGVWGSITSNDPFNKGELPLSDICRYPNESDVNRYISQIRFLHALSESTPTEENPIEIIIDVSNRPIVSLLGAYIQFAADYVASDFSVSFDRRNDNHFDNTINVKNNTDIVWVHTNTQLPMLKIYRIKIVITKALYIESLKYQSSAYEKYEIEYNPNRKVGICNVGMSDACFAGRAFLGECGGNVYGDLKLNKNSTIKNVPTPVDEGDAASKAYVDQQIASLLARIEELTKNT